jgi:uncharacterized membrane protein YbhN (UPF0104 family)
VAIIVFASMLLVALGLGPDYDERLLVLVLFGGSVFGLLSGLLLVAALRPTSAQKVVARCFVCLRRFLLGRSLHSLETLTLESIERLGRLRQAGVIVLVEISVSHILYFGAFAGVGLVLLDAHGAPVDERSIASMIVYIAFTYVAPTPGGAGFAEAVAIPFFGPIVPAEQAVAVVLMFRALTLYLQVGFGLPYMLIAGGLGEIAARVAGRGEEREAG